MNLIIAEKQSVGQAIAAVLGVKGRKDGYIEGGGYVISWCAGHLLGLAQADAYGEQYSKWRYSDLPIIPKVWKHEPSKDKGKQLKTLTELMKRADVDTVVNACDAGREGELIFYLVYEHAKCKKPVKRLWISSMEDAAIRAGLDNVKDGKEYDNLRDAALCREKADWLVGINMTRLFSVLYGQTLNTGRVQSPTLAMLTAREAAIDAFITEPFYTPVIDCGLFTASGEKTTDKGSAEAVRNAVNGQAATVVSVEKQRKTAAPPKLYDLTSLQRDANRVLGFTAQQTLDYAQALYEKKLITYPRTDSRYLIGDMAETVGNIIHHLMSRINSQDITYTPETTRLFDSAKVSDHHAIIPTLESAVKDMSVLPDSEYRVWGLISARLLCAAASPHIYEAVKVSLACGGVEFTAKGKIVITGGWKEIDGTDPDWLKKRQGDNDAGDEENAVLPDLTEGQVFENVAAAVKEGCTSPPRRYTEDTLLAAMESAGADETENGVERRGLGTPATRAAIIEKLIKAGFVEREKKNLIPTEKGKNLIAVLPEQLKSTLLTSEWENKLLRVEHGELSGKSFINGITVMTADIVKSNDAPKPEFADMFPKREPKNSGASLGACPRCGAPVREGARGFFCDTRDCGFKIWKENKFFTSKRKAADAALVSALLKDGRCVATGLYSEKTGKTYDAVIVMEDTGDKFVNFKLEFGKGGAKQ